MTTLDSYLFDVFGGEDTAQLFDLDRARTLLLAYLFDRFSWVEFKTKFLDIFGIDFPLKTRRKIVSSGDVMFGLKFPLYLAHCHKDRMHSAVELRRYAVDNGLAERDLPLLALVLSSASLARQLDNLYAAGYVPMTIDTFRRRMGLANITNKKNTRGYVFSKLMFLRRWGYTADELITEVESRTFEAVLEQYPCFESQAHFNNFYRLAIRQAGGKLIAYSTTQKRNVFDQDGELRKTGFDVANTDGDVSGIDQGWHDAISAGLTGSTHADDDEVLAVRHLVASDQLGHIDRAFLLLMVGDTTKRFESWLQTKGCVNVEEIICNATLRYRRFVMEYLGYTQQRLAYVQALLSGTGAHLLPVHTPLTWTPLPVLRCASAQTV